MLYTMGFFSCFFFFATPAVNVEHWPVLGWTEACRKWQPVDSDGLMMMMEGVKMKYYPERKSAFVEHVLHALISRELQMYSMCS